MDGVDEQFLRDAINCGLSIGRADGVMVSRQAFVAEARSWIGTPFVLGGERKGLGVDCGGLFRGVCVNLGLLDPDYWQKVPGGMRGRAQRRDPISQQLFDHFLNPIDLAAIQPGDYVLISWDDRQAPQHSAIVADYPYGGHLALIHSLPRNGVCSHRLDPAHRRKIIAAYSVPGVE